MPTQEPRSEVLASRQVVPEIKPPMPPLGPVSQVALSPVRVTIHRTNAFDWPAVGPITSYFGPGHPGGIDIALDVNRDSPIRASADGTVAFVGGDKCCDYGYHVILDHANNISTLYAHFARIDVIEGQHVKQGDQLGLGGSTGLADGKHLHFELHKDGEREDPLRFLPSLKYLYLPVEVTNCTGEPLRIQPASEIALDFPATWLPGYVVGSAELVGHQTAVAVEDNRPDGPLHVSFGIPAPAAANGQQVDDVLDLRLSSGLIEENVRCPFVLDVNKTLSNPMPAKDSSLTSPSRQKPTPTSTATPTITPTPTPRPVFSVLTPRPTSTPVQLAGQKTPQAKPANVTSTPAKPATVQPTQKSGPVHF